MTDQDKDRNDTATTTPWMTVDEAVEYLSLTSKHALYRYVRTGYVPCCRLGRNMRFLKEDLDAALKPENDFTVSDVELSCVPQTL